ncbi:MAG: hypothetical protein JO112_20140 [Planctomycetes bacterium]|nr:hypothetical protein [Planctomycetota bacterium]
MKVTIGERLGLLPRPKARGTTPPATEDIPDEAVPVWVRPEKVVRLVHAPSAQTVPVLVIEGQRLSPEDHVAGRRR